MRQSGNEFEHVLAKVEVRFGLRAQGKLETVGEMLAEGRSWEDIGRAIGWDGETAKRFYEMERPE